MTRFRSRSVLVVATALSACTSPAPSPVDAATGDAPTTLDASAALDTATLLDAPVALDSPTPLDSPTAPDASVRAPFPLAVNGGNGSVARMDIVAIVPAGHPLGAQPFAFVDAAVASRWWTTVGADYAVGPAGIVTHANGPAFPSAPDGGSLTDADLRAYVGRAISAGAPAPNDHTLYLLFVPPGVSYASAGGAAACTGLRGFHSQYMGRGDGMGVVFDCPVPSLTELQQVTMTASHEIMEAATDTHGGWTIDAPTATPWTGSPWAELEGGPHAEVGDACEGSLTVEGGYTYQRIWSNTAAMGGGDPCVPAPSAAYYNVGSTQAWYPAAAGTTAMITLTGFSTAATADWLVHTDGTGNSGMALATRPHISGPPTMTLAGTTYSVMNNGVTATLALAIPAAAPSGAWWTFQIETLRLDVSGNRPAGEDLNHRWVLGVYVP